MKIAKRQVWILLAAVFSGILLGLSQPIVIESYSSLPIDSKGYLGWLGFVGYVPLLLILRGKTTAQAFCLAFLASFVQFFIILYWIVIALVVFSHVNPVFGVIVCALLACLSAVYAASGFAMANYIASKFSFKPWILYSLALCAATYASNYGLFGGFPWGNIGYSLATIPVFLQGASLIGVYGLVLFIMLVNVAIAEIVWAKFKEQVLPKVPVLVAILLTVFFAVFGAYKLSHDESLSAKQIKVGLLQGNIQQGIKNKQHVYYNDVFSKYENLQKLAIDDGAQIILWPEVALPLRVPINIEYFRKFKYKTPTLIIGAAAFKKPAKGEQGRTIFHNSGFVIAPEKNMRVVGRFDKSHLVPFGEYVPWPFRAIVDKVVPGMGAWHPAPEFGPINIPLPNGQELMTGATICYEGIFPEISRQLANQGAKFIINLTNDN